MISTEIDFHRNVDAVTKQKTKRRANQSIFKVNVDCHWYDSSAGEKERKSMFAHLFDEQQSVDKTKEEMAQNNKSLAIGQGSMRWEYKRQVVLRRKR
jgi:hypothetical protein